MKPKLMKTMVLVAVMSLSTVGSMVTSVTASNATSSDSYSSYFYKMLGTGTITQYSNTCWAANVALIGRWHTGKMLSATDVADYMGIS